MEREEVGTRLTRSSHSFAKPFRKNGKNFRDKVSDNFRVINHENFRILA